VGGGGGVFWGVFEVGVCVVFFLSMGGGRSVGLGFFYFGYFSWGFCFFLDGRFHAVKIRDLRSRLGRERFYVAQKTGGEASAGVVLIFYNTKNPRNL